MKIFIMGPEGSGKTVLLAMLSRFVATERKDLVLAPRNFHDSQYVVAALAALERGDWPPSTRQGALAVLHWRFGKQGKSLHDIELVDSAGQDMRKILLEDNVASLPPALKAIRQDMDAANILVYLLDLGGFLDTRDLERVNENAWLFKTFLTRPEWCSKPRMVVLSKADRFCNMLAARGNQGDDETMIRELLKSHLPRNYTMDHLVDAQKSVRYFAVASVWTTRSIADNGVPFPIPARPLRSSGLDYLVTAIESRMAVNTSRGVATIVTAREKCGGDPSGTIGNVKSSGNSYAGIGGIIGFVAVTFIAVMFNAFAPGIPGVVLLILGGLIGYGIGGAIGLSIKGRSGTRKS